MLVLSRKPGQQIRIGHQITLTVIKSKGNTVRIGIDAPKDVRVVRAELPPLDGESNPGAMTARDHGAGIIEGEVNAPAKSTLRLLAQRADRRRGGSTPSIPASLGRSEPRVSDAQHPERWSVATMRDRVDAAVRQSSAESRIARR